LNVFHVWDLERSREILTVAPTPGLVDEGSVVLSPDGSSVAIGEYKQIRMYAIGTERPVWTLAVPWGGIPELTFTPDARYVFVGGEPLTADFSEGLVDRGPALVDVATGEVEILQPNLGTQGDPVFSADGNRMAFTHLDWRFTVWDVASRKRIHTGPQLWDSGPAYAMSPDGTVVAVARLGSVELWEPDTHERIGSLQDLTGGVEEIEFDSSGSQIATVSTDGTINVRDARTGELLFAPPAEASDVDEISFSEDGSRLIVVYEDGMIGVHAIALNDAIEIARARVTRGLIDEECQQYLHLPSCPMD
jgi:WD40 repeat protein